MACTTPPLSFRDIFHSGFRSKLFLRCKCALSELKQTVFEFKTTKMLISDYFGVVYRIIDQAMSPPASSRGAIHDPFTTGTSSGDRHTRRLRPLSILAHQTSLEGEHRGQSCHRNSSLPRVEPHKFASWNHPSSLQNAVTPYERPFPAARGRIRLLLVAASTERAH